MAEHPVASGGFAAAAPTHARIRPTYARQVIGAIKERVALGSPVLDLAAGTGILAGQLRRAGLVVLAVEPSAPMLEQLARTLPDVPPVRGVAEALPLATGSVGAVTVADAAHRFDMSAAPSEIRRVLRPGGVLAVVRTLAGGVAEVADDVVDALAAQGGFGGLERLRVPNPHPSGQLRVTELWTWTAS